MRDGRRLRFEMLNFELADKEKAGRGTRAVGRSKNQSNAASPLNPRWKEHPTTTHLNFEAIEYKLRLTGKGTRVKSEGWTPHWESIFAASLWLQNWNQGAVAVSHVTWMGKVKWNYIIKYLKC